LKANWYEWKDSYKIGNDEIDAQHQEWFRKINNFLEATDVDSMARCEAQMYQYTRVHFKHEETLMRAVNYPELHEHIKKHQEMLAHINTMSAQIADFTIDRAKWRSFLSDWLLDHIANTDARLAAYVDD
jgi:hemerythrin